MSKLHNVSLRDVAVAAGVSTMTVSRVLAGKAHVRPALCEAVRKAADRLGYRVNPVVRTVMSELRRGHS